MRPLNRYQPDQGPRPVYRRLTGLAPRLKSPRRAAIERIKAAKEGTVLTQVKPEMAFDAAARCVLDYLAHEFPLGSWSVTRMVDDEQVVLQTVGEAYPLRPGVTMARGDSLNDRMLAQRGPAVAPDVTAVAGYADAPIVTSAPVRAYVAAPIEAADGSVFGTLCGLDPAPRDASFVACEPTVTLLAGLLGIALKADRDRVRQERARTAAEGTGTAGLNGVADRQAWFETLALEEEYHRRFGDPSVVAMIDFAEPVLGQERLPEVAGALRAGVRGDDVVAHLSGSEFAVLLRGALRSDADQVIARLEGALADAGAPASIGYASYRFDTGFDQAVAQAAAQLELVRRSVAR
jgi:GGDEF domain-containing protein